MNHDIASRTWENLIATYNLLDDKEDIISKNQVKAEILIFKNISEAIAFESHLEFFSNGTKHLKAIPFKQVIAEQIKQLGSEILPETAALTAKTTVMEDATLLNYREDIFGKSITEKLARLSEDERRVALLNDAIQVSLEDNNRSKAVEIVLNYITKKQNLTITLMDISKSSLRAKARKQAKKEWKDMAIEAKGKHFRNAGISPIVVKEYVNGVFDLADHGPMTIVKDAFIDSRVPIRHRAILEKACHKYVNRIKGERNLVEFSNKYKYFDFSFNIGTEKEENVDIHVTYIPTEKGLANASNSIDGIRQVINTETYRIVGDIQKIKEAKNEYPAIGIEEIPLIASELTKTLRAKELMIIDVNIVNAFGETGS